VRAILSNGLLVHDCVVMKGDSGAPLMRLNGDTIEVLEESMLEQPEQWSCRTDCGARRQLDRFRRLSWFLGTVHKWHTHRLDPAQAVPAA
jgi:hypothetical protein